MSQVATEAMSKDANAILSVGESAFSSAPPSSPSLPHSSSDSTYYHTSSSHDHYPQPPPLRIVEGGENEPLSNQSSSPSLQPSPQLLTGYSESNKSIRNEHASSSDAISTGVGGEGDETLISFRPSNADTPPPLHPTIGESNIHNDTQATHTDFTGLVLHTSRGAKGKKECPSAPLLPRVPLAGASLGRKERDFHTVSLEQVTEEGHNGEDEELLPSAPTALTRCFNPPSLLYIDTLESPNIWQLHQTGRHEAEKEIANVERDLPPTPLESPRDAFNPIQPTLETPLAQRLALNPRVRGYGDLRDYSFLSDGPLPASSSSPPFPASASSLYHAAMPGSETDDLWRREDELESSDSFSWKVPCLSPRYPRPLTNPTNLASLSTPTNMSFVEEETKSNSSLLALSRPSSALDRPNLSFSSMNKAIEDGYMFSEEEEEEEDEEEVMGKRVSLFDHPPSYYHSPSSHSENTPVVDVCSLLPWHYPLEEGEEAQNTVASSYPAPSSPRSLIPSHFHPSSSSDPLYDLIPPMGRGRRAAAREGEKVRRKALFSLPSPPRDSRGRKSHSLSFHDRKTSTKASSTKFKSNASSASSLHPSSLHPSSLLPVSLIPSLSSVQSPTATSSPSTSNQSFPSSRSYSLQKRTSSAFTAFKPTSASTHASTSASKSIAASSSRSALSSTSSFAASSSAPSNLDPNTPPRHHGGRKVVRNLLNSDVISKIDSLAPSRILSPLSMSVSMNRHSVNVAGADQASLRTNTGSRVMLTFEGPLPSLLALRAWPRFFFAREMPSDFVPHVTIGDSRQVAGDSRSKRTIPRTTLSDEPQLPSAANTRSVPQSRASKQPNVLRSTTQAKSKSTRKSTSSRYPGYFVIIAKLPEASTKLEFTFEEGFGMGSKIDDDSIEVLEDEALLGSGDDSIAARLAPVSINWPRSKKKQKEASEMTFREMTFASYSSSSLPSYQTYSLQDALELEGMAERRGRIVLAGRIFSRNSTVANFGGQKHSLHLNVSVEQYSFDSKRSHRGTGGKEGINSQQRRSTLSSQTLQNLVSMDTLSAASTTSPRESLPSTHQSSTSTHESSPLDSPPTTMITRMAVSLAAAADSAPTPPSLRDSSSAQVTFSLHTQKGGAYRHGSRSFSYNKKKNASTPAPPPPPSSARRSNRRRGMSPLPPTTPTTIVSPIPSSSDSSSSASSPTLEMVSPLPFTPMVHPKKRKNVASGEQEAPNKTSKEEDSSPHLSRSLHRH